MNRIINLAILPHQPPILKAPAGAEFEFAQKKPSFITIILFLIKPFKGLNRRQQRKVTSDGGDVVEGDPDEL